MNIVSKQTARALLSVCLGLSFSQSFIFSQDQAPATPFRISVDGHDHHSLLAMSVGSVDSTPGSTRFNSDDRSEAGDFAGVFSRLSFAPKTHITADDNLGLARLFISSVYVDGDTERDLEGYSDEAYERSRQMLPRVVINDETPGVVELKAAVGASSIKDMVQLFGQGAVTLYAYVLSLGASTEGRALAHVCDILKVRGAAASCINEVVAVHGPIIVINYLQEITRQIRQRLHITDVNADEIVCAFWEAVDAFDSAAVFPSRVESSDIHTLVYKLIMGYQLKRVDSYREYNKTALYDAEHDQKTAAALREKYVLKNGYIR